MFSEQQEVQAGHSQPANAANGTCKREFEQKVAKVTKGIRVGLGGGWRHAAKSPVFALDRDLVNVEPGDVLALMSAGAYGFTMASSYNSRPLPAEVMIAGAEAKVVRRRQSYADLISLELPEG